MDALEEAVNDVVAPVNDVSKEASPAEEVSWIDNPSMTASQYAQVDIEGLIETSIKACLARLFLMTSRTATLLTWTLS